MFAVRVIGVLVFMLMLAVPALAQQESWYAGPPVPEVTVEQPAAPAEPAPAQEAAPVEEALPAQEVVPAEEAAPIEEAAPVEPAPAEEPVTPAEPAPPPPPDPAPMPAPPVQQPGPPPLSPTGSQIVEVILRDDFTVTLSHSTVSAGRVTLVQKNEGRLTHGVGVEGLGVEQFVAPGATLNREITVRPGSYVVYCPVSDHRGRGMLTTLTVQ